MEFPSTDECGDGYSILTAPVRGGTGRSIAKGTNRVGPHAADRVQIHLPNDGRRLPVVRGAQDPNVLLGKGRCADAVGGGLLAIVGRRKPPGDKLIQRPDYVGCRQGQVGGQAFSRKRTAGAVTEGQ